MRFKRFRGNACRETIHNGSADGESPAEKKINITQLKNGQIAVIIEILGGCNSANRLNAMGIIPGTNIVKKSSSAMKGPVVLEKNGRQLAIGFRLAQKIIVEPVFEMNEKQEKPS